MKPKLPAGKARTNYIKLSLTDKEFHALEKLSQGLDNTMSGTVREIITIATQTSIWVGEFVENVKTNPPEIRSAMHLIEQELTEDQKKVMHKIMHYVLEMKQFSKEWRPSNIKKRFVEK